MKVGIIFLVAVSAATFTSAGQAVSGMNGKIGGYAGDMNGETGYNLEGSVALPAGEQFGVQFDGLYTDVADRQFYGAGAHLFWRDPEIGLLGLTGGLFQERDLLESWSTGAEAEYYLSRFTFQAAGGAVNIEYDLPALPFIDTDKTDYYATAGLGFYVLEDLLLSASYTHSMGNALGRGGIEYHSPFPGLSIFADVAYGDYDYDHAMLGVRYYIGKKKTLMQRHREDDPQNLMHMMLYNVGTYGEEFNQKADEYVTKILESSGLSSSGSYGSVGIMIPGSGIIDISSGSYGSTLTVTDGSREYGAIASGGSSVLELSDGWLLSSGSQQLVIIGGNFQSGWVSGTIPANRGTIPE